MKEKNLIRLGILGGTFNPIHLGHLKMAEAVLKIHHLSKVIFIPAFIPPHKQVDDLVSAHHRYKMVKEAISNNRDFDVSTIEIDREGKSYTIDTVLHILHSGLYESSTSYKENANGLMDSKRHEIFLIIGADSLMELESWKDIRSLIKLCHFVVVNRPGYTNGIPNILTDVIGHKGVLDLEKFEVQIPPVDISSSDIRIRLKDGLDARGLVPPSVETYIKRHGLYSCL